MDQMNMPDPQMVNYVMDPHVVWAIISLSFALLVMIVVAIDRWTEDDQRNRK